MHFLIEVFPYRKWGDTITPLQGIQYIPETKNAPENVPSQKGGESYLPSITFSGGTSVSRLVVGREKPL